MSHRDLVIVGAGPAGMAAATEAANAGLSVTLLDEQPRAGGRSTAMWIMCRITGPRCLGPTIQPVATSLSRFGAARSNM